MYFRASGGSAVGVYLAYGKGGMFTLSSHSVPTAYDFFGPSDGFVVFGNLVDFDVETHTLPLIGLFVGANELLLGLRSLEDLWGPYWRWT